MADGYNKHLFKMRFVKGLYVLNTVCVWVAIFLAAAKLFVFAFNIEVAKYLNYIWLALLILCLYYALFSWFKMTKQEQKLDSYSLVVDETEKQLISIVYCNDNYIIIYNYSQATDLSIESGKQYIEISGNISWQKTEYSVDDDNENINANDTFGSEAKLKIPRVFSDDIEKLFFKE